MNSNYVLALQHGAPLPLWATTNVTNTNIFLYCLSLIYLWSTCIWAKANRNCCVPLKHTEHNETSEQLNAFNSEAIEIIRNSKSCAIVGSWSKTRP